MTITALPEATIRLLGSAQALTTPTSLVKELIDNALDAKATAIDILISTNTLDKIELRDNGHGILQEDLDALGRHGHTSKLRSFDELKSIGGLSLGFRGEALASAVQLGEVSVTTKTEGEPAATVVKLKPLGGVASQTRTSNPVGTTITVTNFLSKIPVRKQTALKAAAKTLSKLKDLLQAYSLARPRVRFSLKVIKSSKGSWSYAPRPNDGIKEAISLVIGRDTASQCIEKSLTFLENGYKDHTIEDSQDAMDLDANQASQEKNPQQFVIDMFLPKPDADVTRLGHGQFISIDSRPVSHDKGTMRKIVTLFKSYFKDSLSDSSERLKNPFLWMDIRCPVASYDANVEPAKDDVLFSNEAMLLESIEQAFKDVYGERKEPANPVPVHKSASHIDKFELLKARVSTPRLTEESEPRPALAKDPGPDIEVLEVATPTPIRPSRDEDESANLMSDAGEPEGSSKRKWNVDMSEDCSEVVEGLYKQNNRARPLGKSIGSSLVPPTPQASSGDSLNPWLIAKMTAPLPREQGDTLSSGHSLNQRSGQPHTFLPTPHQTSDPLSADPDILQPNMNQARPRQALHVEDITSLSLPAPQGVSLRVRQPSDDLEDDLLIGDDSTTFRRRNDFISARQLPEDPSMLPGPAQPASFKKLKGVKRVNLPFVPPTKFRKDTDADNGFRQTKLTAGPRPPRTLENPQELPEDIDLAWAMDFEQRKEDATRHRREEKRIARLQAKFEQEQEDARLYGGDPEEITRNSPHKNRYNAAIATLEAEQESSPVKVPIKTTLPDGDPRAYLMKRKRSMSVRPEEAHRRMSRAKSLRLPLERIPEKDKLHELMFSMPGDISILQKLTESLKISDLYVQRGVLGKGLVLHGEEKDEVTAKLKAVFEEWEGCKEGLFEDGGGALLECEA